MKLSTICVNAGWSTLTHIINRGSLVVVSMILARNLDTSSFANYGYFQLTVSMLAAYASLGMGVSASRFFAEANATDFKKRIPLGTLWVMSIFAGAFFAIVVFVLPGNLVQGGLTVPKWILAIGVFSLSLGTVPNGGILGLEQYKQAAIVSVASMLVLISGSMVAGRIGNATLAMSVFIAGNIIQVVGNSAVIFKKMGKKRIINTINFQKREIFKIFSYAGPMIGVSLLAASGAWIVGKFILHSQSGRDAFVLYTIGLQWFSFALFLPGMVSRVVLPRLVRMEFDGTNDLTKKSFVARSALITLGLALLIGMFGGLLSPWLILLYGKEIGVNSWLIGAFLLAAIPASPTNTIGNSIIANNGQMAWLVITIIWFIFLILFSYMWISMGAFAGAIAQGLSALLLSLLAFFVARNRGLV